MTTLLLDQKLSSRQIQTLEQTILDTLEEESVISLDKLVERLPQYTGIKSSMQ